MDPYSTHLKMLMKVVGATTGSVLELGVGAGSTPALHRACSEKERLVVSYDSDPEYLAKYAEEFAGPFHLFLPLMSRDQLECAMRFPLGGRWSVALIDHRPARYRSRNAAKVAQCADYVVCHDTEPENDRFYRWNHAFKHFKHRFDDKSVVPHTTVLSNVSEAAWMSWMEAE